MEQLPVRRIGYFHIFNYNKSLIETPRTFTGAIKSCVSSPTYQLDGLPYEEKLIVLKKVINEKQQRITENNFPKNHVPAYGELRFGLKNSK